MFNRVQGPMTSLDNTGVGLLWWVEAYGKYSSILSSCPCRNTQEGPYIKELGESRLKKAEC